MKNYMIRSVMFLGIITAISAKAQTGLQFTQVKYYEMAPGDSVAISVPSGKVWKVESVSMGSSGTAPSVFLKNSSYQKVAYFSASVNASSAAFPFWLPASFSGKLLNNNPSYRCSVSITEYTVTP